MIQEIEIQFIYIIELHNNFEATFGPYYCRPLFNNLLQKALINLYLNYLIPLLFFFYSKKNVTLKFKYK